MMHDGCSSAQEFWLVTGRPALMKRHWLFGGAFATLLAAAGAYAQDMPLPRRLIPQPRPFDAQPAQEVPQPPQGVTQPVAEIPQMAIDATAPSPTSAGYGLEAESLPGELTEDICRRRRRPQARSDPGLERAGS